MVSEFRIFFLGLLSITFLVLDNSFGQDLANIDKKNPIKVSGGITANTTAYSASGIQNRRDPFYWMLGANINFDILGISTPFSFTLTQQNRSFTQPFNQFGLSPRYKSVTAHLGYRSMQFSNFTLGGNIFLGAGVEVAPSKSLVQYRAMWGRFARAIDGMETDGVIIGQPAFERWGYGNKISVGSFSRNIEFTAFRARDNSNSLPYAIADSFGLKPAENFVVGVTTRQPIGKQFVFDMEYALSAYTNDTRLEEVELQSYRYANNLGPLFTPNLSTQFNKAILANITYNALAYQFRIAYRRIDPEYKTMGSVFLNNDIEDISANISWRMFESKMNIAAGGGIQRNNLDKQLASRMDRLIGSLNVSYMLSQKINLNGFYSNFISNTKFNNQYIQLNQLSLNQNLDSLNYNQVTSSAGGGVNYNSGGQRINHSIFGNANYQKANDTQENNSVFYNVNTGYQLGYIPQGLNFTTSFNYNSTIIKDIHSLGLGPGIGVSKMLFKKQLRSSFSLTRLNTYTEGKSSGNNSVVRLTNSFKRGKHHNVGLDISFLSRNSKNGVGKSYNEIRASILYSYNF